MKVATDGSRTALTLERYEDLLTVRGLPEWQFVGDDTIECETSALHMIGLDQPVEDYEWPDPAGHLFAYQRWVLDRALERERFAAFLTTGLGKTAVQLEWARLVAERTGGRVLLVAPLNIVGQTLAEAARFYGDTFTPIDLRDGGAFALWAQDGIGVGVTNYEKLDRYEGRLDVAGVVLDESSILKNGNGKRRTVLMDAFRGVRWKLACSATPAPNDREEYGEHAAWLEVVRSTREFLAAFFVNRDGNWQLKRHGEQAFYRHLASWSVFMVDPRAFHFDHDADLPPLTIEYPHVPSTGEQMAAGGRFETGAQPSLFGATPGGITSRTKMSQVANGFLLDGGKVAERFPSRKPAEVQRLACDVHGGEQVIVWVTFDREGDQLAEMIPGAVHVSGKTKIADRDELIEQFRSGAGPRVLILKPSMFGFGLNLQACRVQIWSSITDSWERFFQAVRRSWRFGQTSEVRVYVPLTSFDEAVCQNLLRKQGTYDVDVLAIEQHFVDVLRPKDSTERSTYMPDHIIERDRREGDNWTLVNGDCIAHMESLPENLFDLSVFSPPFANLFTYSSEAGDMGNVRSDAEYRLQWKWFAERLIRVMKPGRVVAVHCMDVIRFAGTYGHRHTYDYPSDLRAGMEDAGFVYRARIAIDKDPQVQATRTKDQNLLFVTLVRNALDSHPQAGEYVLVFTAPGESAEKVIADDVSNTEWIRWAHHIWYDIRSTDVLNAALAKEDEDERHICPLQLGLIERCVRLWSNRGETVFSPFAGIGSEGWEALEWGRRYYGIELKRAYFETAAKFLTEREANLASRFDLSAAGS